jgi:hypothetical protein
MLAPNFAERFAHAAFNTEQQPAAMKALSAPRGNLTEWLPRLVAEYFPPKFDSIGPAAGWTTEPLWHVPGGADDDTLIAKARHGKSAAAMFGDGVTFEALWTADAHKLGKKWSGNNGQPYDASSADQSLANRLIWQTGGDCERTERLMRRSALAREKWSRRDYIERTISAALALVAKKPPTERSKPAATSAPLPADNPVKLRHVADIVAEQREPMWIIDDVLEREVLAVLAGPRNTLKSFVALHWAMQSAVAGNRVVILSGEGAGLDRRVSAWIKQHSPSTDVATLSLYALERSLNLPRHQNSWVSLGSGSLPSA